MKGRKDKTTQTIRKDKDNIKYQTQNMDRPRPDKSARTAPAMRTRNMKGKKYNTDDRKKRQGQHKTQNTNMDRHGQNKTDIANGKYDNKAQNLSA